MANKRVSELTQITSGELATGDLLLISDVSAQESKKVTLGDLNSYILTDGNLTASLFGTASWSENSKTASYLLGSIQSASYALTASYALNGGSGGSTTSASWASSSLSSSFATTASFAQTVRSAATASFATSSKFADSASFVIYSGTNNGTIANAISAISATTSTSASFATNARSASFATTASFSQIATFAQSASNVSSASFASYAATASVGITTNIQTSASWASSSISASYSTYAEESQTAISASYVTPNLALQQYGIFLAITQSNYRGQLDKVDIDPFLDIPATASIEAVGTMVAPYTSSILLNESVTLYVLNRATGEIHNVDSTPIYVNIQGQYHNISASISATVNGALSGSVTGSTQGEIAGTIATTLAAQGSGSLSGSLVGQFTGSVSSSDAYGDITGSVSASYSAVLSGSANGTLSGQYTGSITSSVNAAYNGALTGSVSGSISAFLSGSMKIPFTLMGQLYLQSGSYMLFVSASTQKVFIEPTRTTRFSVSSNIGQFAVGTGEPIELTTNNPTDNLVFSSSAGGPFTDYASNIVISASAGDTITELDISAASGIRYVWTLTGLTSLKSNGNIFVNDVQGMPNSIVTMSLQNGILNTLYDLSASACKILNVYNNQLTSVGSLPSTMSYINCSNNPILSLPSSIPYGVTELYADNTSISSPPDSFPTQTLSMSFANNTGLSLWLTSLPSSLSSFIVSGCTSLTALPTIPANVRYLDVSSCAMTDVAQDNICSQLVTNALNSGSLNLLGNASLLPITITRIATLQSRAWTVSY